MDWENKTREELMQELAILRQRVTTLEKCCNQQDEVQQQLLAAEREQRALSEALFQTGTALTSTFHRDEVLDRILDQISRVVAYDAACIILLDGDRGRIYRWRGYAQFSESQHMVAVIPNVADIPSLAAVVESAEAQAVPSTAPDDGWITLPGREWVKSYAVAPIVSRNKVVGLLNIDSKTPGFLEQTEAGYLHLFADQAAVALQNSWLYDRARFEIARRVRMLKRERNFVTAILDTVGALVVVLDRHGRIVRFNRSFEKAVGFTVTEVKHRHFHELFLPPREADAFGDVLQQLLTGQNTASYRSHLKPRQGGSRQVVWTSAVLPDDKGNADYIICTGLDVTGHARAKAALRRNRQELKQLTDNLPVGVYRANQNGKLLEANSTLAALFDFDTVEEMLAVPLLAVYGDPFERRRLIELYKSKGYIENEMRYNTRQGRKIWIRNTGYIVRGQSGDIEYINGAVEDITARRQAEEALHESEERYQHLLASISDHIYVTETFSYGKTRSIYISPHVETLTGYPQEKFVADWRFWLTRVIHPDDRVVAGTHLARALTGRGGEAEYRLVRADGRVVWVRDSVRVENRSGSKILYGVVGDITTRKQAQEALLIERERLEVTLRSIADGVVAIDPEHRIFLTNPVGSSYLAALTPTRLGEVLTHLGNSSLDELLFSDTEPNGFHELTVAGPPEQIFELVAQAMDTGSHAHGWVLILRNVTEQRAVQQRSKQQEQLAAVGQLAAGIAHDFNNILTAIIGLAELSIDTPDLPEIVRADLKQIARQGQSAARLTRQILDFSRRSISEKWPIKLDSFLKEMIKLLSRTISETVRIRADIEPAGYDMNADPTQIQQALTNLAINAQDAMPSGGVLNFRLARFTLAAGDPAPYPELPPGDWLLLSVADTGSGIPNEHLSHLFEPFFTTKEVGKGTGLGLAQVYGIVKQHDGFIDVESRMGVGTTFTLYLPALPPVRPVSPPTSTSEERPAGRDQLLLLVEDNPTVLRITQSMLERLGYRVIVAANGREALALYQRQRSDIELVLTDVTMPEMGGLELCHALQAENPAVKVLAMTGYPLKVSFDTLLAQGFIGLLQKPFTINQVARNIAQALRAN